MSKLFSKAKNIMFGNKKRITITILALLVVSFGIGYFVSAEDDEFAGKIVVDSSSVSEIKDGTPNSDGKMDSCTDTGCDNSESNKIVRNFDSVKYTINYSLKINKEKTDELKNEGYENPTILRTVYVDVFIPKSLNATIAQSSSGGEQFDNSIAGNYTYAQYTFNEILAVSNNSTTVQTNSFTFYINNINAGNGTEISPIIFIYESTSETSRDIGSNFDLETYKNGKTQVNMDNNKVTVTGVEDYSINLFKGPSERDENSNRSFTAMIVVGLKNDENRGIKGKIIPASVSLKLSYLGTNYDSFTNVTLNNTNYTKDSSFTIDSGKESFPYLTELTDNESNNGNIGIDENGNLTLSNIGYLEKNASFFDNGDVNIKIASAKLLKFKATRSSENTSDSNIELKVLNSEGNNELATINFTDIYGGYVGNFSSSIKLYNEVNDAKAEKPQKSGLAVYNYDDTLYIDSVMNYANVSGGETITNFKNYIKVDTDAFTILKYGENEDYKITINNEVVDATVKYVYGSWTYDMFELESTASNYSTCPTSLEGLTKEELMNLYGGPCIKLKDDGNLEDSYDPNRSAMIIETTINNVNPSDKINIGLRAMVKNDESIVNSAHQIVTNSTATYNGNLYYLSDTINKSDTDIMSNKDNYQKTKYNFDSKQVELEHKTLSNSIAGNTVLVSGVRVSSPNVETYYNDSKLVAFDNFPINWVVTAKAQKNNNNSYDRAEIIVYLPEYLVFTTATINNTPINPTTSEQTIIEQKKYTKIMFTILPDNIGEDGVVTLKFDTDITFNTPSEVKQEVLVSSDFYVRKLTDDNFYSDVLDEKSRTTSHEITIYNSSNILTSGISDPHWIEKEKSYNYTVKSFNNGPGSKMELLYVLPYNGDISGENIGSVVSGSLDIKISEIPSGYKIYYTEKDSKIILGNELNDPSTNDWKEWTNYTTSTSNIKAIKIVSDNVINNGQYFTPENGLVFTITPKGNKIGDEYYNRFTMLTIDSNNNVMDFVSSSSSISSVYNRKISGFVFEDSDYDGLYSENTESTMADIPAEIYKLASTEVKEGSNVLDLMSSSDIKVADTITDPQGNYSFRGLDTGYYYIKYTFDCEKYTATDKGKTSELLSNSETVNSNASMMEGSCVAVSDIIELNNENKMEVKNINLGLAVRKVFGINLKKYITNVVVNSTSGIQSYDYNNETKVKIDVKNLKNTSFRITYKFEIENSKYFPGYVGFIGESIPNGMTFNQTLAENDGWVEYGGALYYTKLSNTLIMPGEKYYFTIVLDLKTETAGDYVNLVVASNFTILGEDPYQLNFDDLNIDSGNNDSENIDNTDVEENLNEPNETTDNQE